MKKVNHKTRVKRKCKKRWMIKDEHTFAAFSPTAAAGTPKREKSAQQRKNKRKQNRDRPRKLKQSRNDRQRKHKPVQTRQKSKQYRKIAKKIELKERRFKLTDLFLLILKRQSYSPYLFLPIIKSVHMLHCLLLVCWVLSHESQRVDVLIHACSSSNVSLLLMPCWRQYSQQEDQRQKRNHKFYDKKNMKKKEGTVWDSFVSSVNMRQHERASLSQRGRGKESR